MESVGAAVARVQSGLDLKETDAIVVPGQGHFGQAMEQIRRRGFEESLRRRVLEEKILYIGICIGCQILFEESEEAPGVPGLGWMAGKVVRFRGNLKIPHMGWNEVHEVKPHPAIAAARENDGRTAFFYFVHSYYPSPKDTQTTVGTCDYGGNFACAVGRENIFAVQFHPEKSQDAGRRLLKHLLQTIR